MADCFLKIDGIAGESSDAKHKDEIEVLSFGWGAAQSGTAAAGGGKGTGKAQFQHFSFALRTQRASPLLMLACATGQHLKSATLTVRRAGKQPFEFLTITFTDVLVASFQEAAHEGQPLLLEEVALAYGRIEVAYRPQSAAGKAAAEVKAGWDLKANKKV